MRRAMLAALSVTALALASPGAALAHHGHRGHHHKGKSKAHHARVRFEHFGAPVPGSPPSSDTGTGSGDKGTTTPTVSSSENAGKVTSFENEMLTITLTDGSTIKGKVTSSTEIECMSTTPTPSNTEESPGDDKGSGDDESQEGDHQPSGDQGDSEDGDGNDDEVVSPTTTEPPCDTSALTTGTGVRAAELRIGATGAEFESIELVR
jgi:hypothetical protein